MPEDARRHNRSLVLQSLIGDGPLSRADLARVTHLAPTSTSDLVAGLLDEGLVEDLGRREAHGVGKPATLVGIVPDARHIVTIDLSADEDVHGAVVNLIGKVLHRRTVPHEDRTGQDAVELAVRLAREADGHDGPADPRRRRGQPRRGGPPRRRPGGGEPGLARPASGPPPVQRAEPARCAW